ncbi:MAG: polysaccharide biosynthesis/export family protein [Xanthobacteraceae bacterium]
MYPGEWLDRAAIPAVLVDRKGQIGMSRPKSFPNASVEVRRLGIAKRALRRLTWCIAVGLSMGFAADGAVSQTYAPDTPTASDALDGLETDYRLSVGDVLEISVRGFPDLRQRSVVELNGEVSLPLAGRIRIVGMSIAQAQAAIKKVVTARPLGQKFGDGRESFTVLAPDDVNITIAEYRPVYVLGDIGKPGELPFRPGLTVRQAIALAGGFDVMRYRLINPFTESADMKSRQETLWTELTKVRAQIGRIKAELDGSEQFSRAVLTGIPLAVRFIDQIAEIEKESLKQRMVDLSKEREYLARTVKLAEDKMQTLADVLRNEEEGLKEDKKEYAGLLEFNKRGTVPLLRMMDLRRIQSASSTRFFQARIQFDQAKREHAEAVRALERLEATRRTELLRELQEANVAANSLRAKLSANTEKLTHTSLLKSRLVRGPGAKTSIYIYRSTRDSRQTIAATEDTLLLPGDTVEITLKNEFDVEDSRERDSLPVRSAKAPT